MPRPWRDVHTDRTRHLRGESTDAEQRLWGMLRNRRLGGFKFRRQCALGNYIADFVCIERRLVVELDGSQHVDAVAYDAQRSAWLLKNGYRVLRLWNGNFLRDSESAREAIWAALHDESSPSPREGGEKVARSAG
jgi:very-short-patch-repair endonuclease